MVSYNIVGFFAAIGLMLFGEPNASSDRIFKGHGPKSFPGHTMYRLNDVSLCV